MDFQLDFPWIFQWISTRAGSGVTLAGRPGRDTPATRRHMLESKILIFHVFLKQKRSGSTRPHSSVPLHGALRNPPEPLQTSCLGKYSDIIFMGGGQMQNRPFFHPEVQQMFGNQISFFFPEKGHHDAPSCSLINHCFLRDTTLSIAPCESP